jgi:hypothetical protein
MSKIYTNALVFWNSQQLTQEATVTVTDTLGSLPVKTVQGYQGESPGAPMTEVVIEEAVLASGFDNENAPGGTNLANLQLKFGQLTIEAASDSKSLNGVIFESSFTWGVEQVGKVSLKFRGAYVDWQ